MIISTLNTDPTVDIDVSLWHYGATTEPFIVRIANGSTVHMTRHEAERLYKKLAKALYDYERTYPYKESE